MDHFIYFWFSGGWEATVMVASTVTGVMEFYISSASILILLYVNKWLVSFALLQPIAHLHLLKQFDCFIQVFSSLTKSEQDISLNQNVVLNLVSFVYLGSNFLSDGHIL